VKSQVWIVQIQIDKGEDLGASLAQGGGAAGPDCTTNNGEIQMYFVFNAKTILYQLA
jgi:hypothetical protein